MKRNLLAMAAVIWFLSGCSYFSWMNPFAENEEAQQEEELRQPNMFLWQAALDKLSFMPLQTIDLKDGVIITGWSTIAIHTKEKFKLEVHILSTELRDDSVDVAGFKKVLKNGQWVEENLNSRVTGQIAESIIERARILQNKHNNEE